MLAGDAHHSLLWEFELRIARSRIVKDECIVKRYCKIVNSKNSFEWPGRGARLGPRKLNRGASADSGVNVCHEPVVS